MRAARVAARPPCALETPHQRRVDDRVPKRPDRGHVGVAHDAVRLHEHGHLGAEQAVGRRNPADVASRRASSGWRSPPPTRRRSCRGCRTAALRSPARRSRGGRRESGRGASAPASRRPTSSASQPNSRPAFERIANSARTAAGESFEGSPEAKLSITAGKSSGPNVPGNCQTSSSRKSGTSSWIRHGCEAWAASGSLIGRRTRRGRCRGRRLPLAPSATSSCGAWPARSITAPLIAPIRPSATALAGGPAGIEPALRPALISRTQRLTSDSETRSSRARPGGPGR